MCLLNKIDELIGHTIQNQTNLVVLTDLQKIKKNIFSKNTTKNI